MTDAPHGQLLVVGTPIGNLDDFSPRGQRALAEAAAIFCEYTRVTAKLAARFGFTARRISCPGPCEESRVAELLERLRAGETVALVTDAGDLDLLLWGRPTTGPVAEEGDHDVLERLFSRLHLAVSD